MLKRSYTVSAHAFGPDVPSKNLPFPSSATLTAVELLTFLPHCLQSPDVVYRFASNGCTRSCLWKVIVNNRCLEKKWSPDDCGRLIYKTMRQAGYQNWTIRSHSLCHEDRVGWDNTQLSADEFKVPFQIHGDGSVAPSISFRALAAGVRTFPEGHDALDLTRMVQYALEHQEAEWRYPDDYIVLLHIVGGPKDVEEEHWDHNAFRRWESKEAAPLQARPIPAFPVAQPQSFVLEKGSHLESMRDYDDAISENPLAGRRISFESDSISNPGRTETKAIGLPRNVHGQDQQAPVVDEQSKTDWLRNNASSTVEEQSLARDECRPLVQPHLRRHSTTAEFEDEPEVPIRCLPTFVPPPMPSVIAREEDLEKAFREKRSKAQTDKYGAYAFGGGPRTSPPYRRLHRIHPPDSDDVSAWAENLRWVAEQAEYFYGACMWDESPEHMEEITTNRIRQEWVSEECMKKYCDEEESSDDQTRDGAPRRVPKERILLPDVVPNCEKIAEYLKDCRSGPFPPPGETFFDLD